MLKKICLLIGILLICTSLSACEKKDKVSTLNNKKVENIKLGKNETKNIMQIDLYFDSSDDNGKVDIIKESRLIDKEELVGEVLLHELIKGPSIESQLKPVFPKDTKLLSFSIKDGIAYVNLSDDAKYSMSKIQEEACLKSLVYTLTTLDSINKVKILIDNRNIETLGGNYNASKPLSKEDVDSLNLNQNNQDVENQDVEKKD